LAIALLVVAFVPATAMGSPAPPSLTPVLDFSGGDFGSQDIMWYGGLSWAIGVTWDVDRGGPWPIPPVDYANIHSIMYGIDTLPPVGEDFLTGGTVGPWTDSFGVSGMYTEGIHTVSSWVVEVTPTAGMTYPVAEDQFGIDRQDPTWTVDGLDDGVWHSTKVSFTAYANDGGGSGVEATPTADWPSVLGAAPWHADGVPFYWDPYQWTVTGTVNPPLPAAGGQYEVTLTAYDEVGHPGIATAGVWFDLVAPHTNAVVTPNATTSSSWTNQDVSVLFTAADGAPTPNAGVDYTEYITVEPTNTAIPPYPAIGASGTQIAAGTPPVISETAPMGPVYVFYRSVDKAVPANKEAWLLKVIYIDKNAPLLSDSVPAWWINHGGETAMTAKAGPVGTETFWVYLFASDPNSNLATPGIEFRMPTWIPAWYADWLPYGDVDDGNGFDLFVDRAAHATDGIFPLEYRATDRAGNTATADTEVKIDTRAPVTDGASGWTNGFEPYQLTGTDQASGSGVAATIYRVNQATPWQINEATELTTSLVTDVQLVPLGGTPVQGAEYTIDFGSVDNALPAWFGLSDWDVAVDGPTYILGNLEGVNWVWTVQRGFEAFTGYKTRSVKLDVIAPVVTAVDPKNGNWQKGPAVINFSGTDVGSGYAYTKWSTDGGANWTIGESAEIGGDGEITVTYVGVDNVGLESEPQEITVKVASTPPTVSAKSTSVKKGHKATFKFTVTAVTPNAQVIIQIRTKSGKTVSTHHYANVATGMEVSRSFKVNIKKGKYNIRIGAVDMAGNVQTKRGGGTLTVK
jgi:hypothetical protein